MKLSRSQNLHPKDINNVPAGKCTLNSKECAWINEFYLHDNPQYRFLVEQYEKEKSRNQRLRIAEVFPSKENWVPSFRNLLPYVCSGRETLQSHTGFTSVRSFEVLYTYNALTIC